MSQTPVSFLKRLSSDPTEQAWEQMHELYAPLLRRWLGRIGAGDIQSVDKDDLFQEVLEAVVRGLPEFEHNGHTGAFRSWLRTILVHRVRAFWKSRNTRPNATGRSDFQSLAELEKNESALSRLWDQEHDEAVVTHLLVSVRPQFDEHVWTAFLRQMLDGVPAGDVATELEMSLAAVYQAKCRVLKALRIAGEGLIDDP